MKIVAVIQARLTSTRLPKKVLAQLGDKVLIDHLIDRVKEAKQVDEVVVAIPNNELNNELAKHLSKKEVICIRGDEEDVLSRFIVAGQSTDADYLIRITADNPLTSYEYIDYLIKKHIDKKLDYSYIKGLPIGLATEMIKYEALKELNQKDLLPHHREHVTIYFKENPSSFKVMYIDCLKEHYYPEYSLTVDTVDDYKKMQMLFSKLYNGVSTVSIERIINLIKSNQ